jgi:diguanylate cyclase (GGDEF)-like protein
MPMPPGEIAMSDSEAPQNNPAPDGNTSQPSPMPDSQVPQNDAIQADGAQPDVLERRATSPSAGEDSPGEDRLGRLQQMSQGRKGLWAVVAVICVVAGIIGSLLGAHAVAHTDAGKARQSAQQSSQAIASTAKLELRHEEDIAVGAATYFAGNSNTSPKEFATWVKWAQTLRRFRELDGLSLVTLVHSSELAAFNARITGQSLKPASLSATTSTALTTKPVNSSLRVVPTTTHPYYCLAIANLVRSPIKSPPAGLDYCAVTPGLLVSRDSGQSSYTTVRAADQTALAIDVPVYRGNVTPSSVLGREAASVGWLREVVSPKLILAEALRGHSASALRITYNAGNANYNFSYNATRPGAQSTTIVLHNGWTVQSSTAVPATSVLDDSSALALLIVGCVLSVLLGLLVFLIGGGGVPVRETRTKTGEVPHEDLYDLLTGLPNRALTLDLAERMVARASRQSGMLAGALFIDIDWFKDVNDKLGQAAGDQLLQIVGQRLENVVRTGDTVGRIGGDQFVVLVESQARGVRLDNLARRVIETLHQAVALDDFGPNFFLTASIGVAFGRYTSPEDLLRDAQLALQAAKDAGKDRYTLFNANMRSVIEGRGVLEADLNTALQDKQFLLFYQPIYDLQTRMVVGLEALIRWQHPTRGVLLPADFIPLAEDTGLIVPVGRWVLEEACSRAAAWNVAGHRVGVSVQVSPNQLNRDGFTTDILRALQQSGIEPSLLTLEIAETAVMNDVTVAVARLQEIKRLGVRIAIDDFGTGYAYRSALQKMPLDFLKVDRSSLAASEDEDYRSWLLEAILHFGHDLSLTVIAKGIDTEEHLRKIQAMGATLGQGFFMGEPIPVDAVAHLLDAASQQRVLVGSQLALAAGPPTPAAGTPTPVAGTQPAPTVAFPTQPPDATGTSSAQPDPAAGAQPTSADPTQRLQ